MFGLFKLRTKLIKAYESERKVNARYIECLEKLTLHDAKIIELLEKQGAPISPADEVTRWWWFTVDELKALSNSSLRPDLYEQVVAAVQHRIKGEAQVT